MATSRRFLNPGPMRAPWMTTMRDMPEFCDERACWARVETWCPLCKKFLCVPHDARHECLGHRDDEED